MTSRNVAFRMKILAIEFSSAQRSVALVQQSPTSIEQEAVETGPAPNRPFSQIDEVLRRASVERGQIDAIAVGLGPGSYIGIRAGIALAQGWQLGRETKLLGISSAECVAAQAQREGVRGTVGVVIDAQRGEFYLAEYELATIEWRELQPLQLVSRAAVEACQAKGRALIGPELIRCFPTAQVVWPRASMLGIMALNRKDFVAGEHLEPIYLRETTFVKAPPPRKLPE